MQTGTGTTKNCNRLLHLNQFLPIQKWYGRYYIYVQTKLYIFFYPKFLKTFAMGSFFQISVQVVFA